MRAGHGEPYPALMMPAFAGTRTAPDGSIGVTSIEAIVRFSDGTATTLPIKTLLAPIPRMTTMEASEHVFRRPAVPTSDLVRWLRDRVGGLFPGRPAVRFEVHRTHRDCAGVDAAGRPPTEPACLAGMCL